MPANRKFERGKLAKKTAEAIAAQREFEHEQYMNSEEGKEAEAVLEEYRKKRGPSLMQKHQEDVAIKRAKTGSTALSEMRKKSFDRERVRVTFVHYYCYFVGGDGGLTVIKHHIALHYTTLLLIIIFFEHKQYIYHNIFNSNVTVTAILPLLVYRICLLTDRWARIRPRS
jgi:hypothetical protein